MVELKDDGLVFSFPEVHPHAKLRIDFQRTLRVPDDVGPYPLPPSLGNFPLRNVDDHPHRVPAEWLAHGGVMLPMFQSEAMWLSLDSHLIEDHHADYPFAIKIATGKRCAISGEPWRQGLCRAPQDYLVSPEQPWIDGFVVERGQIRQFVAMPLGSGYSAEEQITGAGEHGGLQISVYPMKRDVFERRFPKFDPAGRDESPLPSPSQDLCFAPSPKMGLAPGGRMEQEIYEDPYEEQDWQLDSNSRCFVHLCNSMVWQSVTGDVPPQPPPTAKSYTEAGLPWFDYFDDSNSAVDGSAILGGLKSVAQLSSEKGDAALPENESVTPENVKAYRKSLSKDQVREGEF